MMYEYMHVARYPSDFSIPNGMQYADGTPVMGASNAEGMKKIAIFSQYITLSLK